MTIQTIRLNLIILFLLIFIYGSKGQTANDSRNLYYQLEEGIYHIKKTATSVDDCYFMEHPSMIKKQLSTQTNR